jgi:PleD family two-component response regulator
MANYKSVLIVDDEENIRDSLIRHIRFKFKKLNYELQIMEANNGEEAVKVAQNKIPDLILMDIRMPVMDGLQACDILRSNPQLDTTVIIFLTAELTAEVKALNSGADDYIKKPFDIKALLIRVERGLNTKKSTDLSLHDPKTGLCSRRYFESFFLNAEICRAKRHNRFLCLMLFKVEKIEMQSSKNENDDVSGWISCLPNRISDIMVIWKENVFAILLPETNASGAVIVAEHFTNNLQENFPFLKLSIGISYLNELSCDALIPFAETSLAVAHDTGFIAINGKAVVK